MESLQEKNAMTTEMACQELSKFLEEEIFEVLDEKQIKKKYPQVISALVSGDLILQGDQPEYTLKEPILFKSGEVDLTKVVFRKRITVSEKTKISKGIDMQNEPLAYSFACMAFLMKLQSSAYLDKFGKYDLKVCEQLSTVFV